MKFVKKLTALFLAVVMAMAMGITAFAANTITAPSNGHTYEIYQIFTGDLKDGTLSNIKWGSNSTGTVGTLLTDDEVAAVNKIGETTGDQAKADALKGYFKSGTKPVATIKDGETYDAPNGYYLIMDKTGTVPEGEAATTYLFKTSGTFEITPKSEKPSFEKKIKDTNDTTGETSEWQDSADYDIGDKVPFQLKGTVASNYGDYTKYYFAFHDVEEEGLTFDPSTVVVKVDGTEIETGYTVKTTGIDDGCTFEIIFDDLKTITSVEGGSVITVEYSSELNTKATIGSEGEVNKAKLEYSNNPNDKQGGEHGTTPWDNVIVFTYKVVVNKVDSTSTALPGAGFRLIKLDSTGAEIAASEKLVNCTKNADGSYSLTTGSVETSFTFSGLDDGTYKLQEVVTPDGYNTISDITFKVEADHTITWENGDRNTILTKLTGTKVSGEITLTANKSAGSLSSDIVNKKGAELPSTGGMGTTVLYVAGIAMILVASVVVIARKRMA